MLPGLCLRTNWSLSYSGKTVNKAREARNFVKTMREARCCRFLRAPAAWFSTETVKKARDAQLFAKIASEACCCQRHLKIDVLKKCACIKHYVFWCFGVQNGARRGHRIWTSYYCSKLVVFASFTSWNGHFPPQTPKNTILGDFHEWHEMGRIWWKGQPGGENTMKIRFA